MNEDISTVRFLGPVSAGFPSPGEDWKEQTLNLHDLVVKHSLLLTTVYTRAGEELTDPQEGCKLKDIQIQSSGEQPCLGVRQ